MEPNENTLRIIGRGLIGEALNQEQDSFVNPWMIIAAGVSDSKSQNRREFDREEKLIKECLAQASKCGQRVIYISTYSVHDEALRASPYVQRKLNIERLITENSSSHIILRLTNVVGKYGHPSNLLNYLVSSINNETKIDIWKHAQRNFLDVDDVVKFTLLLSEVDNGIIELVHPKSYELPEIIRLIEDRLEKKSFSREVESGRNTFQTNQRSVDFFKNQVLDQKDYLKHLLSKYF